MALNRKQPPNLVEWAQSRILHKLNQMIGQSGRFQIGTEHSLDTKAVAVNDVKNPEIISTLVEVVDALKRIETQLSFLTDVQLDGDKL